jgi:hypothetical protein
MTDYSRREVTATRVEYVIPAAPEGLGYSYWGPLRRAIGAIERDLGDQASYDDVVRVEARDDEIVLSYAKEG